MRGIGRVFKRGSAFWVAYSYRGKEFRESSHSESEAQAIDSSKSASVKWVEVA